MIYSHIVLYHKLAIATDLFGVIVAKGCQRIRGADFTDYARDYLFGAILLLRLAFQGYN
jgi:hypothetical protein